MKVYVLASCCGEGNMTPVIFTSKEKALETLKQWYEEETTKYKDNIDYDNLYEDSYQITYVDDTFVEVQLYEVEVQE